MNRKLVLANAILWASAIVAAAATGASPFLCLILLPSLGTISLLVTWRTVPRS